jgi:UDP-N-acetylglucosamine 4,6-dehydratase/5-epimerase
LNSNLYSNKSILITGGTGSLGHALVKNLLTTDVKRIVVYSRDEYKQWAMSNEIKDERLRFFIGDVRDEKRLTTALEGIDYVIHAAALKQVPACEYNPQEAVKTNVYGAMCLIGAACNAKVSKVIAISTDKGVSPVNLYGATKACAEKLFIAANNNKTTSFNLVRYGNVVSARGSVIPLYAEYIKQGRETLPLTDVQMTRFVIEYPQAIELIEHALKTNSRGAIFIPKLKAIKMTDLILSLDKKYELIGIRPGEKIHETLVSEDEVHRCYDCGDNYVIAPSFHDWAQTWEFFPEVMALESHIVNYSSNNVERLTIEEIKELVSKYL